MQDYKPGIYFIKITSGEMPYRFAVVNATQHKLWPIVKEVEVRYERPLFDDGFYYHHRVIVPR
jgi:outer membrane lipoprotein